MNAIFRKSFHFTEDKIEHTEALGFKVRTVVQETRIQGNVNIQFAPDWIKSTLLYKNGVKDRMIVPVTLEAVEAAQQPAPSAPTTGAPAGFTGGNQGQQTGFQPPQQPVTGAGQGFTGPAFGAK